MNSCEKGPGEGGNSTIRGYVRMVDLSNQQDTLEYDAFDQDVYLIYGDDVSFSERTKTSFNGMFEFKYLRKGSYTVYVYSEDEFSTSGTRPVIEKLEINNRKQVVNTDTLFIYNYFGL
ncbi:MAG: hypothetical protein ACK5C5_10180 [Bacteroidota bacterium]